MAFLGKHSVYLVLPVSEKTPAPFAGDLPEAFVVSMPEKRWSTQLDEPERTLAVALIQFATYRIPMKLYIGIHVAHGLLNAFKYVLCLLGKSNN